MVDPIEAKHKDNEWTGCYADRGTFDLDLWLWIFKVKCIVMERKGRESGLMWSTNEMSPLNVALTGVPLTLTVDLQCSMSNCILRMGCRNIKPPMWPRGRGYCWGPGWLKMSPFPSTRVVWIELVQYLYKRFCCDDLNDTNCFKNTT